MATVNPNNLRSVMNVYHQTSESNGRGHSIDTNVLIHENLKCQPKTTSTNEYIGNMSASGTKLTNKFVCYNRGFDAETMYIKFDGKFYNIKHVHVFQSGRFCELTATETYDLEVTE